MKKLFFLLFLSFIINVSAFSQTFEWLRTSPLDYEYNPGMLQNSCCVDHDGNSYFFGLQELITLYNYAMGSHFIHKYDPQGNLLWSRSIEGAALADGIACDSDGDVYIFGRMYSGLNFWNEGSLQYSGNTTDAFLVRITSGGSFDWGNNLTSLQFGHGVASGLDFNDQDELYLAYYANSRSYILIYDTGGNLLQYVTQKMVPILSSIDIDAQGNVLAAGSCAGAESEFGGVPFPTNFIYNNYVVKYNPDLQPLWVKYIEDITCTFPQVKSDAAQGIYLAGSLLAETYFDTIRANGPEWVYDFYLARLDPMGNFLWVRECPEIITGDATVGMLEYLDTDAEGNALLTGITRGVIDWGNNITSHETNNYQDIIIWNYSSDGVVNWVKTAGGAGYDNAHTIDYDPSGNIFITGVAGGTSVWDTITYQSTDFIYPYLAKLSLPELTTVPGMISQDQALVYPNPASERIFITTDRYTKYSLFNITGNMVMDGLLTTSPGEINIGKQSPGLYFLTLEAGQQVPSYTLITIY
ncbi:MAG: T9SS type A sorting domain-containing protein [Bacteroidota bacterium]